ncbi:MAG TPA: pantoate--beta-alanine ligase [Chitinophagaceae bacterium]
MIIYKEIPPLQHKLHSLRNNGKRIGFVPTMGALHDGHLSLIKECKQSVDTTVCSIFVNPTQFNEKKDFEKYPVTIENDIYLLEKIKNEILFTPSVEEIYPEGLKFASSYDLGYLETLLEGYYRPVHFQGVCRVMHKLLGIIQPDDLFMGQKDYQQCMVIKKLIESYDLKVHLHIVPTQREPSGLAMSSRNLLLSEIGKQKASALYKALNFIKGNLSHLTLQRLKDEARSMLLNAGFEKIDYVEICDANTLTPLTEYNDQIKTVALTAAFIEGVRLIDNLILN